MALLFHTGNKNLHPQILFDEQNAEQTQIIKQTNYEILKAYMNLSGKAIAYWLQELKIPKENLLVVVDEIALPFGVQRLRAKGSSAGHNGLKNIEATLSGQDYARLRMGIGSEFAKGKQVDYVLSNFGPEEIQALPAIMDKAIETMFSFCTIGVERAMNIHNTEKN
jgi:PTH1 family peptidyl-tRNA hydrolase